MKKIYIASPYTKGNKNSNILRQVEAANELIERGYNVFAPLSFGYLQEMFHELPHEKWMEIDFDWILSCDAVLRLSGESKGADREVAFAKENDIPVFHKIEEINFEK